MVLSEFANRCLRMDFEQWMKEKRQSSLQYKRDYVGTERYKDTVRVVIPTIETILAFCERGSDNFSSIDFERVLTHFNSIDFNDSYIIELSAQGKYKIVADDQDFVKYQNHNVEVITIVS